MKHRNHEDQESDINDDPLLSAISKDLETVGNVNDNKLLIGLFVLLGITYLIDHSGIAKFWLNIWVFVTIPSIIGYTIFKVVRQKQDVAAKYGLVCHACNYKPKVNMLLSVAITKKNKWGRTRFLIY